MTNKKKKIDFEVQWERRKQAMEKASQTAPDEQRMRFLAKLARHPQTSRLANEEIRPERGFRWIPYAAAAACVAVLVGGGLRYFQQQPAPLQAEKVTMDGEQLYFLCNNQCAAAEVHFETATLE